MRALNRLGLVLGLAIVGVAAVAQERGQHERGMAIPYEVSKEATFTGTVSAVEEFKRGEMSAIMLRVKIGDKEVRVMVGPSGFLNSQKVTFAQGDAITIIGVKADGPRGEHLTPREITRGSAKLTLRDQDGKPLWPMPERGH